MKDKILAVVNLLVGIRKMVVYLIFFGASTIMLGIAYLLKLEMNPIFKLWYESNSAVVVAFMATNIGEHAIKLGKEWIEKMKKGRK
jgi:hypothetical protein